MGELREPGRLRRPGRPGRIADIELRQDDLLADIANRLLVTANSIGKDADTAGTKDALDDGNREIITGLVAKYVYECMNILFPYAKTPVRRCRCDGGNEADVYVIRLTFERERSETQVQELRRLIHDYIVYKCYAEWLEMTLPAANTYTIWEQKAEDTRERIAAVLVLPYEPRKLRVRPHWY